ncbi:hypothetical protein O6H91_23G038400 [Diphasiastrum complanatum]|uniref:Uncharacterized protein n=1 Tax=Diphasiastrum complanatum TaxID=34168 RepID=A0ACC2A9X0_DIPCM|nr:hypothetical protein O6H91_23G038400 [Diphasiastrum complanatum]
MSKQQKLGRLIYFANIPLRLVLPDTLDNIKEVAFRTVPRATKIEIKRVLESVYGLEVEKVNTLNMDGKKKMNRRKGFFYREPAYKKAYVILKNPVTLSKDLFPLNALSTEKESK